MTLRQLNIILERIAFWWKTKQQISRRSCDKTSSMRVTPPRISSNTWFRWRKTAVASTVGHCNSSKSSFATIKPSRRRPVRADFRKRRPWPTTKWWLTRISSVSSRKRRSAYSTRSTTYSIWLWVNDSTLCHSRASWTYTLNLKCSSRSNSSRLD